MHHFEIDKYIILKDFFCAPRDLGGLLTKDLSFLLA